MLPNTELIKIYRHLLNAECGKGLEAKALTKRLFDAGIISEVEKTVVNEEIKFSTRQYLLFLRILPSKGIDACQILVGILADFSCTDASKFVKAQLYSGRPSPSYSSYTRIVSADDFDNDEDEVESVSFRFRCLLQEDVVYKTDVKPVGGLPQEVQDQPSTASYAPPTPAVLQFVSVVPLEINNNQIPLKIQEIAEEYKIEKSAFEIVQRIGVGGFSDVYLAIHRNEKVALKQFKHFDNFTLTMFLEEVNIMCQLNHANVLDFVGYVRAEHLLWLVTKYIHGGSMQRFCQPHKSNVHPLNIRQKISIAEKCWCGLKYLHTRKLCHKDISPGNVLVSNDLNDVKISDFGLAEFKQYSMEMMTTSLKGTVMYYPPEYAGYIRHPSLSDVYSMGASLCELFSEQSFWNNVDDPFFDFHVRQILEEQKGALTKGLSPREPDCRSAIAPSIWNVLQWSIKVDLHQRKNSTEMLQLTTLL